MMRGHQGTEESPSPHTGAVRVGVREVFWAAKMQDLKEGFKDESKLSRQRREWWWGAHFTWKSDAQEQRWGTHAVSRETTSDSCGQGVCMGWGPGMDG